MGRRGAFPCFADELFDKGGEAAEAAPLHDVAGAHPYFVAYGEVCGLLAHVCI